MFFKLFVCLTSLLFVSINGLGGRGRLVGGIQDVDVDPTELNKMANFAIRQMDMASNSLYLNQLVKTGKVTGQVVAGMKYHIQLFTSQTNCMKNMYAVVKDDCAKKSNAPRSECNVVIWSKPWVATSEPYQLLDFHCK